MTDGFLGRWARRKQDARAGLPLEDKPHATEPAVRLTESPVAEAPLAQMSPQAQPPAVAGESAVVPAPTLEDVQTLDSQSDFKRFVAADVDPQVRNAAMKKLFADPHFNVMDGLDIYIDDYSKPDPLPLSMLRKMASAQFLKLVDEEQDVPASRSHGDAIAQPAIQGGDGMPQHPTDQHAGLHPASQAQASATRKTVGPQPTTEDHDDTDLRLQQDHAAGAQGSGRRAG